MASLFQRLLLCLLLVSTAASAQTYSITILDSPGGQLSWASSINAQGQIVGVGNTATRYSRHALQWNDGVPLVLDAGEYAEAEALAINSTGQVVGWRRSGFVFSATLWSGGNPVALPGLGGGYNLPTTHAVDINTAGQIVGSSVPLGDGRDHAVLWMDGVPIDLGTLGGLDSGASAINDVGQIVGSSSISGDARWPSHATLWSNGEIIDLGTLGGPSSGASDVNDAGQIVGWSELAGAAGSHATLWHAGVVTDLGTLGGAESAARAINNNGQIVGWSLTAEGPIRHATAWDYNGPIDLNEFLNADQVAAGWHLVQANDLTSCGCIVGQANNAYTGEVRAFVADPTAGTPDTDAPIEVIPSSATADAEPAPAIQGGGGSTGLLLIALLLAAFCARCRLCASS